jgi:cytochrome c biogenesis protein CcdA
VLELIGALVAGMLTTLAPCVLPLLPVIVGGSMAGALTEAAPVSVGATPGRGTGPAGTQALPPAPPVSPRRSAAVTRALVITASLGVSIVVFTLLLKVSTTLLGVPTEVWQWLSGGLLVGLGLVGLFPSVWERVSARLNLQGRSTTRLGAARDRDGLLGLVLTGAALGPVFTSCSPLYGYVIVTVLPAEPARGMVLLLGYAVGLCATLLVIALAGQRVVRRLGWAADPHGWFRRGLGIVFIVVGLLVATGAMRTIETWIVVNAPVAPWNLDARFVP